MRKTGIEKDEEVLFFEEHFDKMMEWMENDKNQRDFAVPEEWDRDFRQTMMQSLELKESKGKHQRQWKRPMKMAAMVALTVMVGVVGSTVPVKGDGLLDVLKETFSISNRNYVIFATNNEGAILSEKEEQEIFDTESLEVACKHIKQEMLTPIFYFGYFPEGYVLTEAKYDKVFRIANLKLEKDGKAIYILQQQVVNDNTTGLTMQDACVTVENDNLGQKIAMYQSEQDDSLVFSVRNSNMALTFDGEVTIDECEKIIESIYYE